MENTKCKQIMLINNWSENSEKYMGWRLVDVDDNKPIKINKEKNTWIIFDKLEDIIKYFDLKNVKSLEKSNDVDDILWWIEKESKTLFYLADIEGEDYKKDDVDNIVGFTDQLNSFYNDGWVDGWGNNFDGDGNFLYNIDHYTRNKTFVKVTEENTIWNSFLERMVIKS